MGRLPQPLPILAAVRSPIAPRHGALSAIHPLDLLAAVLSHLSGPGEAVGGVDRLVVVCDTPVGAQALNVARAAGLAAGWPSTISATTVDGQGTALFTVLESAAAVGRPIAIAAVDLTSLVPPGAGTTRDYGQPTSDDLRDRVARIDPDGPASDRLAHAAGIDRAAATAETLRVMDLPAVAHDGILAISTGAQTLRSDLDRTLTDHPEPFYSDHGVADATTWSGLADGAAAIIVGSVDDGGAGIARVDAVAATGADPQHLLDAEVEAIAATASTDERLAQAEPYAAAQLLVLQRAALAPSALGRVLATGSAPSVDALRLVVDAASGADHPTVVSGRGRLGQGGACRVTPR